MSEKIEIGVNARLNTAGLEQDAKRVDKKLQDVGKRKIDPIPDNAVKKAEALFQAYLKIDREMARRLKVTNQQGLGPDQIDWHPVYQNERSRRAKLAQLQSFMRHGGEDFAPHGQGGGGGGGFKDGVKGAAVGAAQAGMRAAGPVGGVAANALGTGMSSGFGAGLMGLFGGIAALGVGKLVGSITEKIDQAENNNIAYDRLKRTLGDVNVSFEGLKSAVMRTGEGLNITYDESSALASKFAKLGNVSGEAYRELPGELGVGVGLSRAYGLDNEQGVGFMGQLRGVGVTKDTQDSRRMAILIGETIAKAGAFAKADEVMDAIAGFATSQTRASMAVANVSGYAGMLSSMVGSGLPGMDVQGSAAIMSRMNSALSAGGARGEASQFFTSMVGNRMGLDPLQMQVLREGGMFASKDQMFGMAENGKPSAYQRYMGQTGPTGSSTFLEETRKLIEEKYAGDSETQKLMRAQAFGNHTGLGINQAMAVLSMQPNQMGDLQRVLGPNGLNSVNASGINNAAMALSGTDDDRAKIAASLRSREDLKKEDREKLDGLGSMSAQDQKEVLAKLSAQYEQERTQGTDIRDSRAALDNIKTKIADYAVPALLDMRKALLYMAGAKDGKTPGQVMDDIAKGEAKDRLRGLKDARDTKRSALEAEDKKLSNEQHGLNTMMTSSMVSREEYGKQWKAAQDRRNEISNELEQNDAEYESGVKAEKDGRIRPTGAPIGNPGSINQSMKFFMDKGWTKEQAAGITANLMKESNMRPGAVGDGGQAYGIAQWHPDRQRDFERWSGKSIKDSTVQEQLEFVHYEMTQGKEKAAGDRLRAAKTADDSGAVVSKYYERPKLREAEARERGANAERIFNAQGTPMPADAKINPGRGAAESYNQLRVSAEPMSITVNHKDQWGREVRAPETIQTRINAPDPNTYNHR